MTETTEYLRMFAQFPLSLRRFLRTSLTLDDARAIIRDRLEHREANFLHLTEHAVYGHPRSPYLPLLRMAGCELGDVHALVNSRGLEGALRELRDAGVYITFEEFKGRRPIERNGWAQAVTPRDFDNPCTRRDFSVQTGGSTGAAISVGVDLNEIAARVPNEIAFYYAHSLQHVPSIRWESPLPAFTLRSILLSARLGRPFLHWFSPSSFADSKHWARYGLATCYMIAWSQLLGLGLPWPKTVRVEHALTIARAVGEVLRSQGGCSINSTVSRALRTALAAQEALIDLRGATFVCTSEPATPAKVRRIRESGARFTSIYGMVEATRIGAGCARDERGDDVHLLKDVYALFTHPYRVPGFDVTVPAFNLTSLLPIASKVLLNLQMDDYGIVETRRCGCGLETCGYDTHIREIRSYSKLTGEGVTLIGNEMLGVLEDILPARFGGSPLDYQLVEQEDGNGFTRLYLYISPCLEIPCEDEVARMILHALRGSSSMADAARAVWQHTETLQVMRREPILTSSGKHFPLRLLPRPERTIT